jgi:hypothetical protein
MSRSGFEISTIISGGAPGIDTAAIDVAVIDGIPYEVYDAEWDKYGNDAGKIRNRVMADKQPDGLIAIPDRKSIGTYDMINVIRAMSLPVHVEKI